jgi:hypothetical protein
MPPPAGSARLSRSPSRLGHVLDRLPVRRNDGALFYLGISAIAYRQQWSQVAAWLGI